MTVVPATISSTIPATLAPKKAVLDRYRTVRYQRHLARAILVVTTMSFAGIAVAPQLGMFWVLPTVALLLAGIVHLRRVRSLSTMATAELERIGLYLALDRVSEAGTRSETLAQATRGFGSLQALALQSQAAVMLRQGQTQDAYDLQRALLVNGDYEAPGMPTHGLIAMTSAAYLAALLGELEHAEQWLALAVRGASETTPARALAARMVIALRRQAPEEALAAFDRDFRLADAVLAAPQRRALAALHAFARSQAPGSQYRERPGRTPEAPEDLAGLEYLGQAWPQMAAFLASRRPSQPASAIARGR